MLTTASTTSKLPISTSSEEIHAPFVIVHVSVLIPSGILLATVVYKLGVAISTDVFEAVHNPVPGSGVFPFKL